MKVICLMCEYDQIAKRFIYSFVPLDGGEGGYLIGRFQVKTEKPDVYQLGQTYECKMEVG